MDEDLARRIRHNISVQHIGPEILVYDERRHKAFCLNATSAAIWSMCDGEHTVAQIAASATVKLANAISDDMVLFGLCELRTDGLLEPSISSPTAPQFSRRLMLQRLGTGTAMMLPAIAAIMAPTAAQAYNGCVDCPPAPSAAQVRRRKQALQAQQAKRAQQSQPSQTSQ